MTDAIVLCYHALSPTWDAALSTTPAALRAPARAARRARLPRRDVHRGGRCAAGRAGARRHLRRRLPLGARARAADPRPLRPDRRPCSRRPTESTSSGPLRWPGIDRGIGGPHERELTPMSWDELRALADGGLGDRLAHGLPTRTSRRSTTRRCETELTRSKAACEQRAERAVHLARLPLRRRRRARRGGRRAQPAMPPPPRCPDDCTPRDALRLAAHRRLLRRRRPPLSPEGLPAAAPRAPDGPRGIALQALRDLAQRSKSP